jgi:hypothetical protein
MEFFPQIIANIDAWWAFMDQKFEDPTQKQWLDDHDLYQNEMEDYIQYISALYGDDVRISTPELVALHLFRADRKLTLEETVWAITTHFEDDFLSPTITSQELALTELRKAAVAIAEILKVRNKLEEVQDVREFMDVLNPEDELVDMVCTILGFPDNDN